MANGDRSNWGLVIATVAIVAIVGIIAVMSLSGLTGYAAMDIEGQKLGGGEVWGPVAGVAGAGQQAEVDPCAVYKSKCMVEQKPVQQAPGMVATEHCEMCCALDFACCKWTQRYRQEEQQKWMEEECSAQELIMCIRRCEEQVPKR